MKEQKIIIAFNGFSKSGKDEVGKYLVEQEGFKRKAFGDLLKKDLAKQNGISIDNIENNKELFRDQLIEYGEGKRKNNPLYWVNKTFQGIDIGNLENNIVITDVRRIDELKWLKQMNKKYGNIYIIEVIKPEHWDEDIETIKSIVYGNYYNCFYGRIVNIGTKQDLQETMKGIVNNIYLTMDREDIDSSLN